MEGNTTWGTFESYVANDSEPQGTEIDFGLLIPEPQHCGVCGRSMTTPDGCTITGVVIELQGQTPGAIEGIKQVYPELELSKQYATCFVCWLRALGHKI